MRALRPMTQEEREFAEQHHNLVIDFLRYRRLPMNDFYDIVIFGYLSAVQQYFRNPPTGVKFKAMAFRAMKDAILRDGEYNARAKRCGYTVSLDTEGRHSTIPDQKQDIERQTERKALLEQAAKIATPKENKIIELLVDGFALHEAARLLKMPKGKDGAYPRMPLYVAKAGGTVDRRSAGQFPQSIAAFQRRIVELNRGCRHD